MAAAQQIVTVRPVMAVRLMRLKDAAKYMSMSVWTLRAMIQRSELPAVMPGNNAPWLVDVKDLDTWIDKHKG